MFVSCDCGYMIEVERVLNGWDGDPWIFRCRDTNKNRLEIKHCPNCQKYLQCFIPNRIRR